MLANGIFVAFDIVMSIFVSVNCDVCGEEYSEKNVRSVRVRPFAKIMKVCHNCLAKTPAEVYRDAADIIVDIRRLAKQEGSSPEDRLKEIEKLLGGE